MSAPIDWLYGLQHLGVKLGLDNIRALLAILDHPELAHPSVLVGGTNGKGSVAAMLHAVLCRSGLRCGMYSSPHLVRLHERVRIGRDDVPDAQLVSALSRVRDAIERARREGALAVHPSFFEVITATALDCFRASGVELAVLEVGLGGRLDATNAVDPEVSTIVSVDYDHVKTLGPTLADIATEKAGIVRSGRPLVHGELPDDAAAVVREVCADRGAPRIDALEAVRVVSADDELTLETSRARYERLHCPLRGRHQLHNTRVAVATYEALFERLGREIDPDVVRLGLGETRWAGRLQWIDGGPGDPRLLLDGAHNPAGCRSLAEYLSTLSGPAPVAVFGAMHDKHIDEMLRTLAPHVETMVVTRPDVPRAADAQELADRVRTFVREVECVPDPARALARACALAGPQRFVLVTGSLYLVGQILALGSGAKARPLAM
jgi:dihydrofolate synthase/folylpolyglutamate synthase